MRKLITLLFVSISIVTFAQAPQGINYQSVIRDNNGDPVQNSLIGLKIALRQTSAIGLIVFEEAFTPTTNDFGLINVVIGDGINISGFFSAINWSNGPYFIEISADETGGTNYSIMGTQQLMSVPYALYAENAGNASSYQGVKIGFDNTTTWVCPTGVTQITVEAWGAGGGNGGSGDSWCSSDTLEYNGGIGGSGGYNKQSISVNPSTSYTITIGNGGSSGVSNLSTNGSYVCGISNGTDGESSSFDGLVTAIGGTGGLIGCSQCNNTIDPGANGTSGAIINYVSATSINRPYIPGDYLGVTPGCCAGTGAKGLIVISY